MIDEAGARVKLRDQRESGYVPPTSRWQQVQRIPQELRIRNDEIEEHGSTPMRRARPLATYAVRRNIDEFVAALVNKGRHRRSDRALDRHPDHFD